MQPVGDDDDGAAGEGPVEGRPDESLRDDVDGRRHLIEDDDRRRPQQGARDAQQLALADATTTSLRITYYMAR